MNLLARLAGRRAPLVRTYVREGGTVVLETDATQHDFPAKDTGTPTYDGLPLADYVSVLEMLNPMHRLWSDGRWNKITLAHGCYWKKCSFCDVSLDYIGRYDRPSTDVVIERIRALIAETGQTGFHFVDEAAPPAGMRALAKRLLDESLSITWWGNIRFEKTFTPELCALLAEAGCVAVSGGLEVASDRLLDAHEERRHGRASRARHARIHGRRHHGARVFDVRFPDGDRARNRRRARARPATVRGRAASSRRTGIDSARRRTRRSASSPGATASRCAYRRR